MNPSSSGQSTKPPGGSDRPTTDSASSLQLDFADPFHCVMGKRAKEKWAIQSLERGLVFVVGRENRLNRLAAATVEESEANG